jgi:hypothetical protein
MQFKVSFSANKDGNYHPSVDAKWRQVGLDLVDMARKETGVSNLSVSLFEPNISRLDFNPFADVSERVARIANEKSGVFSEENVITVQCDPGQLNGFVFISVNCQKSPETGEIKNVEFKYSLHTNGVIDAWIEAGCPLDWSQPKDAALTETSCAGNTDFAYEN